jgi:hypothetical protein
MHRKVFLSDQIVTGYAISLRYSSFQTVGVFVEQSLPKLSCEIFGYYYTECLNKNLIKNPLSQVLLIFRAS